MRPAHYHLKLDGRLHRRHLVKPVQRLPESGVHLTPPLAARPGPDSARAAFESERARDDAPIRLIGL